MTKTEILEMLGSIKNEIDSIVDNIKEESYDSAIDLITEATERLDTIQIELDAMLPQEVTPPASEIN